MKKLLFVLVTVFSFFSCTGRNHINISINKDYAIEPGTKWARIKEPLASYKREADFESETVAGGRKGEIEMIRGLSRNKGNTWYLLEKGWLSDESVDVYSNYLRAKNSN
ncbi:MAG: hypothetical protein J5780_02990 [Treponema sp.]|nr:hypothetical protein [Treponema sp.]